MLLVWVLVLPTIIRSQTATVPECTELCTSCPNQSTCIACADGFELNQNGQCISGETVQNCQLYGPRGVCLICKPHFRLAKDNRCEKMMDGCLISDRNGQCVRCIAGAILNHGLCDIRFMNCKMYIFNTCIYCEPKFKLVYGKCISADQNCEIFQPNFGFCLKCKTDYRLVGFQCMNLNQSINCLMAQDQNTCIYCKSGYQLYFGKCSMTKRTIQIHLLQNFGQYGAIVKKCSQGQYYDTRNKSCQDIPKFCQKFDYGYYRCKYCKSNTILIGRQMVCGDPSLIYCLQFSQNSLQCKTCLSNYYLTPNKLCKPFPPFCLQIQVENQQCVKCRQTFLLNPRGSCEDPNCQTFELTTSNCLTCKPSYIKNATSNICVFYDFNCLEKEEGSQTCRKCRQDYIYDKLKNVCQYVDPYCKINDKNNLCLECHLGHYLNKNTKICMQLPYKCLRSSQFGECEYCSEGYALTTSRQCKPIYNISNCETISQNLNLCAKCKQKYYLDDKNNCLPTPLLCIEYDALRKSCKKCQRTATNKNGICYDNFCQIFDQNAQCLGCKKDYEFNKRGECIAEKLDQNCKEFIHGLCKSCFDRFYFDNTGKCTSVSNLCRTYDRNSGDCTSCYSGYAVQQGKCIRSSQIIQCDQFDKVNKSICLKCHKFYQLNNSTKRCQYNQYGCILKDANNKCIKCKQSFYLDRSSGYCLNIKNISEENLTGLDKTTFGSLQLQKKKQYIDENCMQFNSNRTQCTKCIVRKYFSKQVSKCVDIDPLCKDFVQSSGQCLSCFQGYSVTKNKMQCQLQKKSKDSNCKQFMADSQVCKECYPGYMYSEQKNKCVQDDKLCQAYDMKSGFCKSCYIGYTLKQGKCVIQNGQAQKSQKVEEQKTNPKPIIQTQQSIKLTKCLQFDESQGRCVKCIKDAVYDEQLRGCFNPVFGPDKFCTAYRNKICVLCLQGYSLKQMRCQIASNRK